MKLQLDADAESGVFKIPFENDCDGFVVALRYLDKAKVKAIVKTCQKVAFKNRQRSIELDDEKLASKISAAAIVGWEGLTPEIFITLAPAVDEAKMREDLAGATTISCGKDEIKFLLENSYSFSDFIDRYITDIDELKENELKN